MAESSRSALPLHEIRSEQPLDDRDFVRIRTTVMEEVRRGRNRPESVVWRLAVAAAIAIAVGIGAFIAVQRTKQDQTQPSAPTAAAPSINRRTGPARVTAPPETTAIARAGAAVIQPSEQRPGAIPGDDNPVRVRTRKTPEIVTASNDTQTPLHIEIQTADPDIRIIWIANPTIETDSKTR
jgi:hypothetical protein